MSKNKTIWRLVLDDYERTNDIGVVEVINEREHLMHHWVTFPDNQVRQWYNHRELTNADADMMISFEMVPQLKVSYRPISKLIVNLSEYFYMWFFLILAAFIVCSVSVLTGTMLADYFFQVESSIFFNNFPINYITGWFSALITFLGISCLICNWAVKRYYRDTIDDKEPHQWSVDKFTDERDSGWI